MQRNGAGAGSGAARSRHLRNVRRSVARRLYEIEQIGRRPTSREAKLEALKNPYTRLLRIEGRVARQARAVAEASKRLRRTIPGALARSRRVLEHVAANGKQFVTQTRARILRRERKSEGKLVSISRVAPTGRQSPTTWWRSPGRRELSRRRDRMPVPRNRRRAPRPAPSAGTGAGQHPPPDESKSARARNGGPLQCATLAPACS